jgi:hypothetical protein
MLILALAGRGFRLIETVIFILIATIGACYLVEILIVRPGWPGVARGLITPALPPGSLFIAIGIIGATVMPHNLYLHSDVVRTRIPEAARCGVRPALRHLFWDTATALNFDSAGCGLDRPPGPFARYTSRGARLDFRRRRSLRDRRREISATRAPETPRAATGAEKRTR